MTMTDPKYFACSALHVTMRVDRCDESRARAVQHACITCTRWAQEQAIPVEFDLSGVTLSPTSQRQHLINRAGISWKPDVKSSADTSFAFGFKPQAMPTGYDRNRLMRESGVSAHSWARYFNAEAVRADTYQRMVAFLARVARQAA